MPLPGTRVIGPRWSEHHRPTANDTLTSTCTITRRNGTGSSDANGRWTPPPTITIYEGGCRIVPANVRTEAVAIQGEKRLTRHRYDVDLEWDCPNLDTGDIIHLTASQDPGMVGKQLRVVDLTISSEEWTRHLTAVEFEEGD